MALMKVKCPECHEEFELDNNEYDEHDRVECPECSADLLVKVKGGKFKLATDKEKYFDEDLNQFFVEED